MSDEERLNYTVSHTEILRSPRQALATFGITHISYYLLTRPAYAEAQEAETVVRRGKVIANRPRIVTPYYLSRLDGFSVEARHYFQKLIETHGPNAPGIYYTYRNEPQSLDILSDNLASVVAKINDEIDKHGELLSAIIKGEDELWDVSLMKFIFDMTNSSMRSNLMEFQSKGLLSVDNEGVPAEARLNIEGMFQRLMKGEVEPRELKDELERWGLFEEYQDRFLAVFRR